MKVKKNNYSQFGWLKKPMLSQQYRFWLIDNGSLTKALQQRYASFAVNKITLHNAKPLPDEVELLNLPAHQQALIREVLLLGNQQPVVFAHSVLPHSALRGPWNKLGFLGNKPLGATLFANPKVQRTPLSFKKLAPHHALFKKAAKYVSVAPSYLWARRSVFSLYSHGNCAKILVTEVFLPNLIK